MFELQKALDIAFQDQVVQKIMPKMRGIETRGRSLKECLKVIEQIICDNDCLSPLAKDYSKALHFGQGQFLWLSADYLNQ